MAMPAVLASPVAAIPEMLTAVPESEAGANVTVPSIPLVADPV